ncbi:family 43 glycosylhydrolase [Streptomyces sp. SAS_272]|uniref:family 43 glycosylhydrolase n=1 Tax=Streptomyces sp. SAS_272 TaxID=3412747 RepID=UPI00403D0A9E
MTYTHHSVSRRTALAVTGGMAAGALSPLGPANRARAATTDAAAASYPNPVIWQDFADIDIIRVGGTYYCSASTMHYSPGAPVLRSYDLVNWEIAGHSVPVLDFGSKYDLNGGRGYVRGVWASSLAYRPGNGTFYWLGQIDFAQTYLYTATSVEGPWKRHATLSQVYYDAGLLVDDDDTLYVAYGNSAISVAQLSPDGRSQVRSQQVFSTPSSIGTLEGSRFYKINGNYYIFLTRPANGQYILKSTSGPFGPYTLRQVLLNLPGPVQGGGVPHQGGLVRTQAGAWYYMAFVDAYPGGRMPALAPVTWTADGWPVLQLVNGAWGTSYPSPVVPTPPRQVTPLTGVDTFDGTVLKPKWEWNHNPDNSKWSAGDGLTLRTATVTNDLYGARNTLTHRIQGPTSTATIQLEHSAMRDGDRAGLALLRDSSAWIGLQRDGGVTRVVMVDGLTMDGNWKTTGTGTVRASASVPSGGRLWLRAGADIRPGASRPGVFSYSSDGVTFTRLGPAFSLGNDWRFFMGYRFALFNHATQALGGSVRVTRFELSTP